MLKQIEETIPITPATGCNFNLTIRKMSLGESGSRITVLKFLWRFGFRVDPGKLFTFLTEKN